MPPADARTTACEMIHVSPGIYGLGEESPCMGLAVATVEGSVRACIDCARGRLAEGLPVTFDHGPASLPSGEREP